MKENIRYWGGKRRFRPQPPLGTHEPNKPELCYLGEKTGHWQDTDAIYRSEQDVVVPKRSSE
jgi:hypothetical protein